MIGDLLRVCQQGRRDARAGIKRRWASFGGGTPAAVTYMDAWRRETEAMRKRGQLPQGELPLDTVRNAVAVTDSLL